MTPDANRSRSRILALLCILILLGIWSRIPDAGLAWTGKSFGDTLWATMFYLWIILLLPRMGILPAAAITLALTFAIEFLKLYHVAWLDALRAQRIPGFLLGHDFYWRDLAFYAMGTLVAVAADMGLIRRGNSREGGNRSRRL
jgi:hypothetical protein